MQERQEHSSTMRWSGIDVSKLSFDASWIGPGDSVENFQRIARQSFPMSREGVAIYVQWLQKQVQREARNGESLPVRVVMESTGSYSLQLVIWLMEAWPSLRPAIINPKIAKSFHESLGLRNKTDEVDSRSLGLYGRDRCPRPYEPGHSEYRELRALERQRQALLKILAAEQMRLQENLHPKAVERVLKSHVRHLEKLLQRVQEAMYKLIRSSARLQRDIKLLVSIPGVGVTTAMAVLGELGDLRLFRRSRQITAMAGLTPRNHRSGQSKKPTRVDRVGNPRVRKTLYMPAMTISRLTNTTLGQQYHSLVQRGLEKMQALAAIMRKLLVLMRAIVVQETPYQEDYASQS